MCANEKDRHECHDEYGLKLWNSTALRANHCK